MAAKRGRKSSARAGDAAFQGLSAASLGMFAVWAAGNQIRRVVLLTLICLALMVPGLMVLGPTDRDEARFAQASKQMIESGDYVDIRFQEEARHKKPAGIYWAQAGAASLFGGADAPIWAYRLPSILGAILASLLTVWAARPLIGARAAFLAGAMTAALLMLNYEARIAKTDALLLASIIAAQGALARLWFGWNDDPRERGFNIFYFWTALAAGVLIKGPIIFLPVLGSLLWMSLFNAAPRGRLLSAWGRLGWSWGLVWLALLAAPWFIAIGVKTGGGFFFASLGEDLLAKVSQGQEAHWGPPGYYLAAFWGTFWPWTALAPIALYWTWNWARAPETAFLLGWIVPTWVVFELVSTKLPHYVLPTYPAICILIAAAVLDGSAKPRGVLFWLGALLWAIPAVALPVAFAVGPFWFTGELDWRPIAAAGVSLLVLFAAWRWLMAGVWLGFVRASIVGAGLLYLAAFQFGFPSLTPIWTSERLASLSAPLRSCVAERQGAAALASVGYHEPSLVFLTNTDTALLGPAQAADWLGRTPGGMVWVEDRRREAFETALTEQGLPVRVLAETDGFNYNRGKEMALTLFAAADDQAITACAAGGRAAR